jgi:hypothetical protein
MADAEKSKCNVLDATRMQDRRTIPTGSGGPQYALDLDRYVDRLLDEALDDHFPAGDFFGRTNAADLENK